MKTITLTLDDSQVAALVAQLGVSSPTPSPTPTPTPSPTPTPTPADPALARFFGAPSDWARWTFFESSEFEPFVKVLVGRGWQYDQAYVRVNQQINAYQSTLKLAGYHYPGTNNYSFRQLPADGGKSVPDTNGAADFYVAKNWPGVIYSYLK